MINFKAVQAYIHEHRAETQELLQKFFQTDTLFFWSENEDIYAQQKLIWFPLLKKIDQQCKTKLNITTNLLPPDNDKNGELLFAQIKNLSDKELTICFLASTTMKSVLLGFLLCRQKITPQEAFNASFLEEICQNQRWGKDEEALARQQQIQEDLVEMSKFLSE